MLVLLYLIKFMMRDSKVFFEKYVNDKQVEFYSTRGNRNVIVKVKDTDHVLDTFVKKSLILYYKDQGKLYRFNTCHNCKKVNVFEILGGFEFGEYVGTMSKPQLYMTETENPCDYASNIFWKYHWFNLMNMTLDGIVEMYELNSKRETKFDFYPGSCINDIIRYVKLHYPKAYEFQYHECGRWVDYNFQDVIIRVNDIMDFKILFLDMYMLEYNPARVIIICERELYESYFRNIK